MTQKSTSLWRKGTKAPAFTPMPSSRQTDIQGSQWATTTAGFVLSAPQRLSEDMGGSRKHNRKWLRRPLGRGAVTSYSLCSGSVGTHSQSTGYATLRSLLAMENQEGQRLFFPSTQLFPFLWIWQNSYRRTTQSQPFSEPPGASRYPGLSLCYES